MSTSDRRVVLPPGVDRSRPGRLCTHSAASTAREFPRFAPVPCQTCRGWIEPNGSVHTTAEALKRHPEQQGKFAAYSRRQLPDYRPSVPERLDVIGGALSRAGGGAIRGVFWLVVLLVIVVIGIALLTSR